jgi:hypothetical protein
VSISTRELNENDYKCIKKNHKEEKKWKRFVSILSRLSKADGNFICISFDLQKVLNTPQGQYMSLYYSYNYSMFNLIIYEFVSQLTTGIRGCNETVTYVYKYLLNLMKNIFINNYEFVMFYNCTLKCINNLK